MRSFKSLRVLMSLALVGLAACGGSDDDDGSGTPIDAPMQQSIDAAVQIDGATAAGGLGQVCNQAMPCPTNASSCLFFSDPNAPGAKGFCSLTCATQQMNMPNAQGQFPRPATGDATCAAAFAAGQPGMPVCGVILSGTLAPPVPAGQQPNPATTYTYDAACIVTCGAGNTCPTGLTCQQGACIP